MTDELDVKKKREERIRRRRAEEERQRKQKADEWDEWDRQNPRLNLDAPYDRQNPYEDRDHRPEEIKWAWDVLKCIEEEAGDPLISPEEKAKLLEEAATQRKHAESLQATFDKQVNKELIWVAVAFAGILFVIIIGTLMAASLIGPLIRRINIWGTIILVPLIGMGLFRFRNRHRFYYGSAEFAFGVFSALNVFIPTFDYSRLNGTGLIQLAGGLYIVVRGLDNMGTGLKGTAYEPLWNRIF